jgi:hypothetical protein
MNVSSDASNKGENDEYTGNGDRDHDPEEGEEQERGKGDEACESEEGEETPSRRAPDPAARPRRSWN